MAAREARDSFIGRMKTFTWMTCLGDSSRNVRVRNRLAMVWAVESATEPSPFSAWPEMNARVVAVEGMIMTPAGPPWTEAATGSLFRRRRRSPPRPFA